MDIKSVLSLAREIAENTTKEESFSADKNAEWVAKTMEAAKKSKLTGLVVNQSSGGLGHGLHALVQVCEILGSAYSSAGLCFGMHCVGSAVINAKATEWQEKNYLTAIAEGKHLTTLALSEPGTGAHFYIPETGLKRKGNEFELSGQKTFVTNGGHADSYVVSTVAVDETAAPGTFSCVIVDAESKGITWGEKWNGLGMRGNSSRAMKLDNVKLSNNHILGSEGDQLWYVFNVVAPYFLSAMAGTYLGVAEAAFQEAKKTVAARHYSFSGNNLSQTAVVQHKLGYMYEKLQSARSLIYNAAQQGDHGTAEAMNLILSAKTVAASAAVEVVNEAMTLAGGIGYRENSLLGMLMRDARAAHVMSPTTDILYTWIGRSLLDQPLLSE